MVSLNVDYVRFNMESVYLLSYLQLMYMQIRLCLLKT